MTIGQLKSIVKESVKEATESTRKRKKDIKVDKEIQVKP